MKSSKKSLKSKFGKKYQIGGTKNIGAEFKAPAPFGTYTTPNQPEGTISTQDRSFAPGVFSDKQAQSTFTPMMSPLNIYDVDLNTAGVQQGPLNQSEVTERGIQGQTIEPSQQPNVQRPLDYNSMFTIGLGLTSMGLNQREDQRNRREFNQSVQNRQSQPLYDYNYMYGRTSSGGTEYQPIVKAEMGAQINKRYNTPNPINNVEIEGGEFLQLPDMSTEMAYGPSHSNGGIQTFLPEGTKVFSNHLKPMGSKKTFAQMAKKYDNTEYDKTINNKFAKQVDKDTAMLMREKNQKVLDKLFLDQQLMNGNSNGEAMAKNGASINNAGFRALPQAVQQKILSNMEYGGFSLPNPLYMQDGAYNLSGDQWNAAMQGQSTLEDTMMDAGRSMTTTPTDAQMQQGIPYAMSLYDKSKTTEGATSPTGESVYARKKSVEDYVAPWMDLIPNSLEMTEGEFQSKVYDYALENDPQSIRNMWSKFGITNKGKADKELMALTKNGKFDEETLKDPEVLAKLKQAYVDGKLGARTLEPTKGTTPSSTSNESDSVKTFTPKKEKPNTPDFQSVEGKQSGKYYRQPFPIDQAIPGVLGLAASQEIFPYSIPELDAPYIRPQTLNIQSQLQDIDNMGQASVRAGADPLSAYIAGIGGKEKAFQTKQNFDAQGRMQADQFNAQAQMQADRMNAMMFDRTYNQLIGQARDAQTAEQQAALTSIINNYSKYNQDENLKSLYLDNLQSAFEIGKDRPFSMTVDPKGRPVFSYDTLPNQVTTETTTENKKPKTKSVKKSPK